MTRVSLNGSLGSPKAGVFCLRIRSIEGARERLESGYPMLRMRRNRLEIPMKHIEEKSHLPKLSKRSRKGSPSYRGGDGDVDSPPGKSEAGERKQDRQAAPEFCSV